MSGLRHGLRQILQTRVTKTSTGCDFSLVNVTGTDDHCIRTQIFFQVNCASQFNSLTIQIVESVLKGSKNTPRFQRRVELNFSIDKFFNSHIPENCPLLLKTYRSPIKVSECHGHCIVMASRNSRLHATMVIVLFNRVKQSHKGVSENQNSRVCNSG
jgi:hypothetical protein